MAKHNWIPIVKTFLSCIPMIISHAREVFSVIKAVYSEENQREIERIKEEANNIKEQLKYYDNNVNEKQSK